MTIKEFYEGIGSDYQKVLGTLMNDKMASKFALRFFDDTTMNELCDAVAQHDIELSFRASHTLKGIAGNLGFYNLQNLASTLCEQLRPKTEEANLELFNKVKAEYEFVLEKLTEYKNSL